MIPDNENDPSATANLPILPEIAQNLTPSHSFPADPTIDHTPTNTPIPCTATPIPLSPPLLSTRQLNAIPLILAGYSDTQVAASVGVRRESVCRWRNQHPRFIAELNRQRHLLHSSTADRYHALLNRALAVFEDAHSSSQYFETKLKAAAVLLRTAPRRAFATPTFDPNLSPTSPDQILQDLLSQGLSPSPDDSPAEDAPPPPPPPPSKPTRRSK